MDYLQYTLLNKLNKKENNYLFIDELSNNYIELLNKIFKKSGVYYKPQISKDDIICIYENAYNVLRFRLSKEEFIIICDNYINNIVCDQLSGNNIDFEWLINHIYYFIFKLNNKSIVEKSYDSILLIQDIIVKQSDIQDNLKSYLDRRIYTKSMIYASRN